MMAMVLPEVEGPIMAKTFSPIDQDRRDPFSNWSGIVSAAKAGVIKKGIMDAMIANMRTKLTYDFLSVSE